MTSEEKLEALKSMLLSRGWKEVVKPALERVVSNAEMEWLSGTRGPGREKVTEDMLRQTIIDARWMLDWERRGAELVKQLDLADVLRGQTEPATEGGSPYA